MDEQHLQAKKTLYKGIEFKSKLEAKTAQSLDNLAIEWEYEPDSFQLPNGLWYRPDFHLPRNCLYIECKGQMDKQDAAKIYGFADAVSPIIVLNYNQAVGLLRCERNGEDKPFSSNEVYLCKCGDCGENFLLLAMPFRAATNGGVCPSCGSLWFSMIPLGGADDLFDTSQSIAASQNDEYANFAEAFNRNSIENSKRAYGQD